MKRALIELLQGGFPRLFLACSVAVAGLGILGVVNKADAAGQNQQWKKENILIFLAERHLTARDYENTVLAADAAIALNPANPRSRNLKANALNQLGRHEEAKREALRSIGLHRKGNVAAHLNLAVAKLKLPLPS